MPLLIPPLPPPSLSLRSAMLFQNTFSPLAHRQTKYSDWCRQRSPITNYKRSGAAAAAAAVTEDMLWLFTDNEPRANGEKMSKNIKFADLKAENLHLLGDLAIS